MSRIGSQQRWLAIVAAGGVVGGGAAALAGSAAVAAGAPAVHHPSQARSTQTPPSTADLRILVAESRQLSLEIATARHRLAGLSGSGVVAPGHAAAAGPSGALFAQLNGERSALAGEAAQLRAEQNVLANEARSLARASAALAAREAKLKAVPTHSTTGASGAAGGGDS